jgi:formyl-CoA transferase
MPALDGMRILDMTQYEAGTSCTQALAWLGADVVKIERPGDGDPGRRSGRGSNPRPYFLNWNSNKRSLALDLQSDEGRELFLRLVPRFDVFVENYGPGVIEKLQIDYPVLRDLHPALIYARIKGFGLSGPYSNYKSYDMVAQAAGGAFSVTGDPDGPPMRPGFTVGDTGTGMQMALSITAAYVQQLRSGEGQLIELSMQEAMTYYMRTIVASGSEWGTKAAPRRGNRGGPGTDLYPCTPFGSNDYVYIMIVTSRMWDTLCIAMDRADLLTDPRFASEEARIDHVEELCHAITQWTSQRTKHEAMHELGEAGVPVSAVLDTRDLHTNEHLLSRDFIQKADHPEAGTLPYMRWPPRMSANEVTIVAAPLLGEHTLGILREELGLADSELEQLQKTGAVAQAEMP